MQLNPYREVIEEYVAKHEFLVIKVRKAELESKQTERYVALLSYVLADGELLAKYCGKMVLDFPELPAEELWSSKSARSFVRELNATCPGLFFLAEKEGETLKLLTALECASEERQEENLGLDKERFQHYLQQELKQILALSARAGFAPERAQSLLQDVYSYFGLA